MINLISSPTPLLNEPGDPFYFKPVPVARRRRDGWTPDAQVCFVQALARLGSVVAAARSVGRTPRGAYALRAREGGEEFAAAWDNAMRFALSEAASIAMEQTHALERGDLWEPSRRNRRGAVEAWRTPNPEKVLLRAMRAADYLTADAERPMPSVIEVRNRRRRLDRLERDCMKELVAAKYARDPAAAEASVGFRPPPPPPPAPSPAPTPDPAPDPAPASEPAPEPRRLGWRPAPAPRIIRAEEPEPTRYGRFRVWVG